jgi:hypothetical protein
VLTEAQLVVLEEKARAEKEAHGEFESEHPGYCGAQNLPRRAADDEGEDNRSLIDAGQQDPAARQAPNVRSSSA